MEHGVLTDPVAAGRENLLHTYIGLARAVPGAVLCFEDGYVSATGPQEFSFCNFLAGFGATDRLDGRIERVAERARERSGTWVFCMDGDFPGRIDHELTLRGFIHRQSLAQMVWETYRLDDVFEAVREPDNMKERFELCQFASRTFFTKTPGAVQDRIAWATSRSEHRLAGVWDADGVLGSVMISESASAVGIYNLCVRRDGRGAGWGRALVEHGLRRAVQERKVAVLQCEPGLCDWYLRFGFQLMGSVSAYTSSSGTGPDIL